MQQLSNKIKLSNIFYLKKIKTGCTSYTCSSSHVNLQAAYTFKHLFTIFL